ncbi:3-oxoacyl-[acyl-carrier-protein] synthase, KASIII [Dehalobacter sp. UNSWDHB]|uniref:beta-ketoacyl-ACP synthase III n=1 Tax=Dehalobacter sp. UNSWDHB TaxID=1339256 RepID=UPI0003878B3F|nr:beta-ketoacyl-ACP synthase 3 [Dehalobacter sp. UNSWDHB]EQB20348.1 3-oxoacyl-[acyl-carrier-protein] synthase, KASIII [Dehalobacter sp. UNSWDHB]
MYDVEIIGTGSYVPENRVTNDDLSKIVDTSDEWISTRTGIKERRISLTETTADLAVAAARRALDDAGVAVEELDLIIVATVTPDYFFPSTACFVQNNLGASRAACFDISAACTGFIFGLSIASQFIRTGMYQKALIIGAEALSKITDWEDRSTCVLFADGAGAAVIKRGDQGIISEVIGSDGSKGECLECPALPLKNIFIEAGEVKPSYAKMNGREVFKFAVNILPECILKTLEKTPYTLEDINHIIPHQANLRIIDSAAKKLKVDQAKFYVNLPNYGNTSSASIPIALDEMAKGKLIHQGDLLVLVGFGGGLTYGAMLIKWTIGGK